MHTKFEVKYNQIWPNNWRCGDIVSDANNQYCIEDVVNKKVVLRKLEAEERSKAEFISFTVTWLE